MMNYFQLLLSMLLFLLTEADPHFQTASYIINPNFQTNPPLPPQRGPWIVPENQVTAWRQHYHRELELAKQIFFNNRRIHRRSKKNYCVFRENNQSKVFQDLGTLQNGWYFVKFMFVCKRGVPGASAVIRVSIQGGSSESRQFRVQCDAQIRQVSEFLYLTNGGNTNLNLVPLQRPQGTEIMGVSSLRLFRCKQLDVQDGFDPRTVSIQELGNFLSNGNFLHPKIPDTYNELEVHLSDVISWWIDGRLFLVKCNPYNRHFNCLQAILFYHFETKAGLTQRVFLGQITGNYFLVFKFAFTAGQNFDGKVEIIWNENKIYTIQQQRAEQFSEIYLQQIQLLNLLEGVNTLGLTGTNFGLLSTGVMVSDMIIKQLKPSDESRRPPR